METANVPKKVSLSPQTSQPTRTNGSVELSSRMGVPQRTQTAVSLLHCAVHPREEVSSLKMEGFSGTNTPAVKGLSLEGGRVSFQLSMPQHRGASAHMLARLF